MANQAVALAQPQTLLPTPETFRTMLEMAEVLVRSGMLPESIKTPQAAFAILQKGSELGLPPMASFSGIAVIKGKPTCSAELMQALIYRDHGDDALRFVESTDTVATLEYRRRSWRKAERLSFTIEMAKQAGLTGSPTWRSYPAALLRARCISAVARMAFADSLGGLFTPEELGAQVDVRDGEVVLVGDPDPHPLEKEPVYPAPQGTRAPLRGGRFEGFPPAKDTPPAGPPPAPLTQALDGEIVAPPPPPLPPAPVLRQALAADLARRFGDAGLPPPPPDPDLDGGARDAVLSDALTTLLEHEAPSERGAKEAGLKALRQIIGEFHQAGVALGTAIPPDAARAEWLHKVLVQVKRRAVTGEVGDVHRAPAAVAAPDVDENEIPY